MVGVRINTCKDKCAYIIKGIIILLTLFLPSFLYSVTPQDFPHYDRSKLPRGCASCHIGHGVSNTPMLPERKENFCLSCHGSGYNVEKVKSQGLLSESVITPDMQRVFEKPYRHPIETSAYHRYDEILPERDPATPRHVACVDCHHHHFASNKNKVYAVKGVDKDGSKTDYVVKEYELCFKCHSFSANLPGDQVNKAELFNDVNPSYHPVCGFGKNNNVPSLVPSLNESSIIKCTDCHNNDDTSGPKGPHGSNYRHILKKNFVDLDGGESEKQYELCYSCHLRSSILNDESFTYHSLHIVSVGASCRTCHNPHGSTKYTHLIDFDNLNISPAKGRILFVDLGNFAGQCYLTCHGKEHSPKMYPSGSIPPSDVLKSIKKRR